MWRRTAAKLSSLLSSPWSARLPNSGNLSKKRQDLTPLSGVTGHPRVEPEAAVSKTPITMVATPLWSSTLSVTHTPESKKRREKTGYDKFEFVGGDLVDYDFINGPFGTKESPAVMRSYYDAQIAGCCGPDEAQHDPHFFWLYTGVISVCPVCSQHLMLKCVGMGGFPPEEYCVY